MVRLLVWYLFLILECELHAFAVWCLSFIIVSRRWMAFSVHPLKERMSSRSLTLLVPSKYCLVAAKFWSSKKKNNVLYADFQLTEIWLCCGEDGKFEIISPLGTAVTKMVLHLPGVICIYFVWNIFYLSKDLLAYLVWSF